MYMNFLFILFVFVLFFILTPGILVTLPKKGSKMVVALVHGVIFATTLAVSKYFFWKSGNSVFEGETTNEMNSVASEKEAKAPPGFKKFGTHDGVKELMENLQKSIDGAKPKEMSDKKKTILLNKIAYLEINFDSYFKNHACTPIVKQETAQEINNRIYQDNRVASRLG